eukprot:scaffold81056_cov48-Phaeocystis_antarctica.AAC.1
MGRDALLLGATAEAGGISSTAARRALSHADAGALRRCCGDAVAARLLALPAAQVYTWRPAGGEPGWAVEEMDVAVRCMCCICRVVVVCIRALFGGEGRLEERWSSL